MAKTVCILNHKGGVGKTTTSVNLAVGLANEGKRVCLIDLDTQRNATRHLGITNSPQTIFDVFEKGIDIPLIETCGIYLCPSALKMKDFDTMVAPRKMRETLLKKAISPIKEHFDYIIIDCPPSLGTIADNALTAADSLLIPLEADFLSFIGVDSLFGVFKEIKEGLNHSLEIEGVVLTKYNHRLTLTKDIETEVEQFFKSKLYSTAIGINTALAKASAAGTDIFTYAPDSKGAKDYKALVTEFLNNQK